MARRTKMTCTLWPYRTNICKLSIFCYNSLQAIRVTRLAIVLSIQSLVRAKQPPFDCAKCNRQKGKSMPENPLEVRLEATDQRSGHFTLTFNSSQYPVTLNPEANVTFSDWLRRLRPVLAG